MKLSPKYAPSDTALDLAVNGLVTTCDSGSLKDPGSMPNSDEHSGDFIRLIFFLENSLSLFAVSCFFEIYDIYNHSFPLFLLLPLLPSSH